MKFIFTLVLVINSISLVWANTNKKVLTPGNMSSIKMNNFFYQLKKKSSFSHFSTFEGPAINNISTDAVNENGQKDGKINSWHQISYRYQINKRFRFVINPRFTLNYANDETNPNDQAFNWINPVLGITGTWFSNGNFSFTGGINTLFLNVEEDSRKDKLIANPGGFQTLNYKVNNNIDTGAWYWFRFYAYEDNRDKRLYSSSVSPYIKYTLSDKISFQGWYDTYIKHTANRSLNHLAMSDDFDIGLGMFYSITKKISIFPHLRTNPDKGFKSDSTTLNAWLFGSF
ncbi:MAG: hypothetical protein N4A33_04685 [Bacteriovoracaceae bacterium]|jgi:hypothetical protein|nr:hypothetical protein [Bacteriovoracaceae bacterium]